MKATYGFRATVTARPGKGDELVALLLAADGRNEDDVPLGGKFSAGGTP